LKIDGIQVIDQACFLPGEILNLFLFLPDPGFNVLFPPLQSILSLCLQTGGQTA
jgi:hypothetical protein